MDGESTLVLSPGAHHSDEESWKRDKQTKKNVFGRKAEKSVLGWRMVEPKLGKTGLWRKTVEK